MCASTSGTGGREGNSRRTWLYHWGNYKSREGRWFIRQLWEAVWSPELGLVLVSLIKCKSSHFISFSCRKEEGEHSSSFHPLFILLSHSFLPGKTDCTLPPKLPASKRAVLKTFANLPRVSRESELHCCIGCFFPALCTFDLFFSQCRQQLFPVEMLFKYNYESAEITRKTTA